MHGFLGFSCNIFSTWLQDFFVQLSYVLGSVPVEMNCELIL